MRIEYDSEHDLLNIVFLPEAKIEESVEVDGIVIDYAEGPGRRIASIEVLDAGKRTTPDPFALLDVTIVRNVAASPS